MYTVLLVVIDNQMNNSAYPYVTSLDERCSKVCLDLQELDTWSITQTNYPTLIQFGSDEVSNVLNFNSTQLFCANIMGFIKKINHDNNKFCDETYSQIMSHVMMKCNPVIFVKI